ncbi:hypothetical protein BVI434_1830009 [Burkholderia vietnamiensis]|nr:hypothetical protein BVI434_1830009 [Burkholderia vietnamiensis]
MPLSVVSFVFEARPRRTLTNLPTRQGAPF